MQPKATMKRTFRFKDDQQIPIKFKKVLIMPNSLLMELLKIPLMPKVLK